MGFKQGDSVTVQGLRSGCYEGMISDGTEGTVGMRWAVEGEMYGVEFSGISGMLLLYGSELALTEDLRPPTSWVPVIGERVVSLEDPEHVEGVVIATSSEACAVRFDDYDSEVWCNYDELGRLESPTSRGVVVGDRVRATWGSFEGSVGTVRETKIAGGTGRPIASVVWDDAPWVYSDVLEVLEPAAAPRES